MQPTICWTYTTLRGPELIRSEFPVRFFPGALVN